MVAQLSGGSSKRIHARAAGGMIIAPQGEYPEGGVSPSGRFFGDFLIGEKVTLGAEHGFAMLSRSACIMGRRDCRPA